MSYASVDPQIRAWARRHRLVLFTAFADRESRFAYVSSKAGDCFQMWVEPPVDGHIRVGAALVDGQWLNEPTKEWQTPIPELDAALEDAFATVVGWMVPSERYYPKPSSPLRAAAEWIRGYLK
jgi:hypothetical protein